MTPDSVYTNFSAVERVDAEKGIVFGVSVITVGEAKGHGLFIDETSLSQILSLAKARPDGVKVKADHNSGVFGSVGKLVNFRKDGDKIRADLELLKSDENYDKMIEMATKLSHDFGLSVSTSAKSEKVGGKKMVRFTALESVDLVSTPAANDGLFSAKQQNNNSMTIDKVQLAAICGLDPEKATDEEITAAFEAKCKKLSEKPEDKKKEEKEEKDEKFSALSETITQLAKKLESIEAESKVSLEAAKKTEIATLIAAASAEGKVIPLSDVQLSKMDIADVKEMFSKLPKGQLKLSKGAAAPAEVPAFKTDAEKVQFCVSQREAGAAQLTAQFAAAGLVQLN